MSAVRLVRFIARIEGGAVAFAVIEHQVDGAELARAPINPKADYAVRALRRALALARRATGGRR